MKKIFCLFLLIVSFSSVSLPQAVTFQSTAVLSGASTSAAIFLGTSSYDNSFGRYNLVQGIELPSAFVGDSVSFQAKNLTAGNAWYNVYSAGLRYALPAGASRYIALNPDVLVGVDSLKVLSGTVEAPDLQTSNITIYVQTIKK